MGVGTNMLLLGILLDPLVVSSISSSCFLNERARTVPISLIKKKLYKLGTGQTAVQLHSRR
jgi:hypothetical protein